MATLARALLPLASTAPVPLTGVLVTRFAVAFCAGIVTVGVLSKVPDTVTAALALAGELDELQPARTAQAASGTSRAAAKRRMCFLSFDVKTSQPTATGRLHCVSDDW